MSTPEPGLDLHEWQTERESLQEQLEESPEEALPDFADLVGRVLEARSTGDDPELQERYDAARDVARLAESGDADPGDVADAINNLSELFDALVVERGAP
ncbi:MAG TPA: hypothetical protein VLN26_16740 [Gaiellaceae bacterium]|nr:hypothetical protein [Gaiellaceae bacterium]